MPKVTVERDDAGRYLTSGLDEHGFNAIFNMIGKAQRVSRRGARRTLTPVGMKNKTLEGLLALGKKQGGTFFTADDLKAFDKSRQKHKARHAGSASGIMYSQLVASALKIDVDRANNRTGDDTGITNANMTGIRGNVATFRVKASRASVHQEHRVQIRLEEWDDHLTESDHSPQAYQKAMKAVCAGRVSFDCDCGRHQYWYRYMATVGNYALAPPKEFAYPKIRNKQLKGTSCKHVLKVMVMLQSSIWQRLLARQMESQASRVGFGEDRASRTFDADDQKELKRNRSTQINQKKLRAEFDTYKRRQEAMGKKLSSGHASTEKIRQQLRRARKQSAEERTRAEQAENKARIAAAENKLLKTRIASELKLRKQMVIAAFKMSGKTEAEALVAFEQMVRDKLKE
ncbi:MAG TPA: phage tail protein [Buttiauxella sp.]|jgi:hypothetical protein